MLVPAATLFLLLSAIAVAGPADCIGRFHLRTAGCGQVLTVYHGPDHHAPGLTRGWLAPLAWRRRHCRVPTNQHHENPLRDAAALWVAHCDADKDHPFLRPPALPDPASGCLLVRRE